MRDNYKNMLRVITVPLRNMTVLPGSIQFFDVSREKSIAAIEKAMSLDERVCLFTQKQSELEVPKKEELYESGCYVAIKQLVRLQQGNLRVMVEGLSKCSLFKLEDNGSYFNAYVAQDETYDIHTKKVYADPATEAAMVSIIKEQLAEFALSNQKFAAENMQDLVETESIYELCTKVAAELPWDYKIKQAILDAHNIDERYELIVKQLFKDNQVNQIKFEFQKQLRENIDQNQKEYILREQMKIIKQELNEDFEKEGEEYEKKLAELSIDEGSKEKLSKEINRLKNMPSGSQEANVIRNYLDVVFDIPFNKYTEDNTDIGHAAKILDADHYGLEKVKSRVLEYLSVRILNPKSSGSILCLVGPPGTGKTSIAKSVARAMDKKYVRISLGGVRDEAEIRGHRKTYIGAMPGRFVEGLRQAKVSNPLMLLDEIDKVSSDYKGDTASALLEVLDAEQNYKFRDHYVELPVDLSKVLFIATANNVSTIPRPLLDRMELIEINSYTENEKLHIAKDYLVKKQLKANGLEKYKVKLDEEALKKIIHNYTKEAGVRTLERRIGEVYRKCARKILEENKKSISITAKKLSSYLGKPRYNYESANEADEVGICRGLAWTAVGGDTLQIEVSIMPGKGGLLLTGQMGDVMKESARIALSAVRSMSKEYKVADDFYDKHDIHLHIPEGAVPKDGPSAGITMATAMLSAVIQRKIRADVAMTGELSLRGRVLPIGGLKEKILAAKMADIKTVIVPYKNKIDIEELSKEISDGLEIVYVKELKEVLKKAFA